MFLHILYLIIPVILFTGFLVYASAYICSGFYVKALCRGSSHKKEIALTFDDGPHVIYTNEVLDILKKYGIHVTFFVVGARIRGNEQIIRRMSDEGHQVGNHSYSHSHLFPFFRTEKMISDLQHCEQMIKDVNGFQVQWFRPPFGVTNPFVAAAVKNMNYKVAGWSLRSLDTTIKNDGKLYRRIIRRIKPGTVILLHDHLSKTPLILEDILKYAIHQGYSFVTMEQMQKNIIGMSKQ